MDIVLKVNEKDKEMVELWDIDEKHLWAVVHQDMFFGTVTHLLLMEEQEDVRVTISKPAIKTMGLWQEQ